MSTLWRPDLFSALGAGFSGDPTLTDGVHLRWNLHPLMGLPVEFHGQRRGGFSIYVLNGQYNCLDQINLMDGKRQDELPVHCSGETGGSGFLETAGENNLYFNRSPEPVSRLASEKLLNQLNGFSWFWKMFHSKAEPYLDYLEKVAKNIKGPETGINSLYKRAEICAVDMRFKKGEGTNPDTGDGSLEDRPGCLGRILGLFGQQIYARVRAYDRRDNLLAEGWIGRYALSTAELRSGTSREKMFVKFRAAGIYRIQIRSVPGMPKVDRQETCWVFCEEYCNAPVWQNVLEMPLCWKGDSEFYDESVLQTRYYAPFKKTVNWTEAVQLWRTAFMASEQVQDLVQTSNSFTMYDYKVDLDNNSPDSSSDISATKIPFLASLMHSAHDPGLASLLGLYYKLKSELGGRDVKIEAHAPFFEAQNLQELRGKFQELVEDSGQEYYLDDMLGYFDISKKSGFQLGGLVMCPAVNAKPSTPDPDSFTTIVNSIPLPQNDESGEMTLFIDDILRIPRPPFHIEPWLNAVSQEVERKLDSESFVNTAGDETNTALKLLGIVPPINISSDRSGKDYVEIRDNFQQTLPAADNVQYRVRSFDIFGRPSGWVDGSTESIPVPCGAPSAASNLSARIERQGDRLQLEMVLSMDNETGPLQALSNQIEIAVHRLDPAAEGTAEEVQWSGSIRARGLTAGYNSTTGYPDPSTLAIRCLNLEWSGDTLNWSADASNACDAIYPPDPPVMENQTDLLLPDTDTNFRTYRMVISLGSVSDLGSGTFRWCTRVRIRGGCDGTTEYSRESCATISYTIVPPPPPVVQPSLVEIPESTYPDKLGNSYYNIDLAPFIPSPTPGSPSMVNIYRINLDKLSEDISVLVEDNVILPGAEPQIEDLARQNRSRYERINEKPVEITDDPQYYPVQVPGDLEAYHVIGIVGTNPKLEESPWEEVAVIVFKTPAPVPVPQIRYYSGDIKALEDGTLQAKLVYRADFESEVDTSSLQVPKVQIIRHDVSLGTSRFAGEASGDWEGDFYRFSFIDAPPHPWRRYRYEARLLVSAEKHGGGYIKSGQSADGLVLVPGLPDSIPLDDSSFSDIATVAEGLQLTFEFLAGEFDFSITKITGDGTRTRHTGRLIDRRVAGLPGADLEVLIPTGRYRLVWTDPDTAPGSYTLRLFRAQQIPWTHKINTP